jgi:hypothetical protein
MVHDEALEPKRSLDPAPAIGLEFITDGGDGLTAAVSSSFAADAS